MSSIYHGQLTVSIFGQSHAPAIGVTVDGLPAGEPVDLEAAPGLSEPPGPWDGELVHPSEGGGPAGVSVGAQPGENLRCPADGGHSQYQYPLWGLC